MRSKCFSFLCFVVAIVLAIATDPQPSQKQLRNAAPHPGSSQFLGKSLTETMSHYVNKELVKTSVGKLFCEYAGFDAPFYLRASYKGVVKLQKPKQNGATSLNVTWIGWNNVVQNIVDRYLIVKELDGSGAVIDERCSTYPDVNPKGYSDPLPLMADRYKLARSSPNANEYVYQWRLQNGAEMASTMMTAPSGFPPTSVSVNSTMQDGRSSSYSFSYSAPNPPDSRDVFYEYKKYDCIKVTNFTTPEVCVDSWLALQYECAFTEGLQPLLHV